MLVLPSNKPLNRAYNSLWRTERPTTTTIFNRRPWRLPKRRSRSKRMCTTLRKGRRRWRRRSGLRWHPVGRPPRRRASEDQSLNPPPPSPNPPSPSLTQPPTSLNPPPPQEDELAAKATAAVTMLADSVSSLKNVSRSSSCECWFKLQNPHADVVNHYALSAHI